MLATEQGQFFDIVTAALNAYAKFPEPRDLEAWWAECRGYTLEALQVGLKSHKEDPDRGERAPRPADITRRLKTGNRDASKCSATDLSGRCDYPGIFSEGTMGEGPWYCPWHRIDRSGPEASRYIEASRNVPYDVARSKRDVRMLTEAQHAPGVTETAHAIALRHGNRSWQSRVIDFIPEKFRQESEETIG